MKKFFLLLQAFTIQDAAARGINHGAWDVVLPFLAFIVIYYWAWDEYPKKFRPTEVETIFIFLIGVVVYVLVALFLVKLTNALTVGIFEGGASLLVAYWVFYYLIKPSQEDKENQLKRKNRELEKIERQKTNKRLRKKG